MNSQLLTKPQLIMQNLQQNKVSADTKKIEIENLSLSYGNKNAFTNVNMSIYANSINAIIGPSGCGKTSFIRCLNRLTDIIPQCNVTGSIKFNGLDILHKKTDVISLRRDIGMIFQKPNPFPMSIRKNLEYPIREHGIRDKKKIKSLIQTSLEDVGLWHEVKDRLDTSALSLSGGQQQRLCIARALALSPKVILMDEPCSSLDPISSGVVEDLIYKIKSRLTVIIITHDLAQAKRIASYASFFWVKDDCGTLVESGTAQKIFNIPGNRLTMNYINGVR